ncbi:phosphoglycerate kinase [Peptoanaerobacter stomatis]|uniref:Phosphoglycerate kinase n=1 Tax=Peptoanaerobacter stomatis TaxID=796937 RepID=J5WAZ7_9FIRM|nr:phosphoglycerate kinase [Peptoanaerobacter stomatis]EJU20617.1 phosphoglycerate kinase [Peptoanaerobacter stomatis]NWO25589.1 phosphoglycerate kinase [Peptostreptococcaceae bacterium oral taxon 081]
MAKKSVKDIDVSGKKVIVRCDFNVPMKDGKITDDIRIVSALPTIKYLIDNNAKVILMSHLGRPDKCYDPKYSLKPVAVRLSELLGQEVKLAEDENVVGENAKKLTSEMKEKDVVLLENVRFVAGETKNDANFAKELASLADIFVNDAFGTAHRAHSSTAGIADYIPAVMGFLIEKEVSIMGKALENPQRPFVAILGGAKVSDKISVIENLINKVDTLVIGGAMAYTFLKSQGKNVGTSRVEEDKLDLAKDLLAKAEKAGIKLLLPIDHVVAKEFSNDAEAKNTDDENIPDGFMGLDIGEKTVKMYCAVIADAKTAIWNGPMGVFEMEKFAVGTKALAEALSKTDAISIIGGGDSAAAVEQLGFADKMTHISTGGGASLEFLEGKILPGIDCLQNK